MSDQPEIDPEKLNEQDPDYVENKSGSEDLGNQPDVGTDPMSLPQEGAHKTVISPDPEQVREAEREGRGL